MVQITLVVAEVSKNFDLKTADQIKSRTRKTQKNPTICCCRIGNLCAASQKRNFGIKSKSIAFTVMKEDEMKSSPKFLGSHHVKNDFEL